ncbi:MAG TPA: methylmalonyl Co-A mutase-associated GTPase MeaB [Acidimicrobiales bacterium]|nr:methylmalonyl Co-A mutase-associated GTPase MeaB [Acidimicrobiales bacterium]
MTRQERLPNELLDEARSGSRASLAQLLSLVERGGDSARSVGKLTFPLGGSAYTVGMTGAPGAGKSTLTGGLVRALRAEGDEVAVLAIDPTSPFTGGAILGDRVRMQDHALDAGVFIRSMATRGHLGGLALATPEAVRVLDAVGFAWVIVETVGVGQVEVEIAGAADTTLVVVNPGWGDAVQASKAGLLEIADVFVINKADRPGADEARRDLEHMLDLASLPPDAWRPPIVATVASTGDGVGGVIEGIAAHRAWLGAHDRLEEKRAARLRDELVGILSERVIERVRGLRSGDEFARVQDLVAARELDPWTGADELLGLLE